MSVGRHAAYRAEEQANKNAVELKAQRGMTEDRLKREKERAQKLFIRQVRAKQGGGFFEQSNKLG